MPGIVFRAVSLLNRRLVALNMFSHENILDKYNVCALKF